MESSILVAPFFHVICKVSNFDIWTAKHLAQAACTELTLPKTEISSCQDSTLILYPMANRIFLNLNWRHFFMLISGHLFLLIRLLFRAHKLVGFFGFLRKNCFLIFWPFSDTSEQKQSQRKLWSWYLRICGTGICYFL